MKKSLCLAALLVSGLTFAQGAAQPPAEDKKAASEQKQKAAVQKINEAQAKGCELARNEEANAKLKEKTGVKTTTTEKCAAYEKAGAVILEHSTEGTVGQCKKELKEKVIALKCTGDTKKYDYQFTSTMFDKDGKPFGKGEPKKNGAIALCPKK